jgi:hypothetical protein
MSTIGLDLQLTVGGASTQITVEATAVAIHTEDTVLGATMRNDVYESLPLAMNLGVPRGPTSFSASRINWHQCIFYLE